MHKILINFIIWRVGLLLVWILAVNFLAYQPSFVGSEVVKLFGLPDHLSSWANFDGFYYLTLAQRGYLGIGLIQAFFPLYPLLIKSISILIGNFLVSGLVISNLCMLLNLYLWQKLMKSENVNSSLTTWLFLVFPTSFYFGALYNESLFLTLVLASFLAMKTKKWWLAATLAGLASATRLVGVFLLPSLIWELWQSQKIKQFDKTFVFNLMLIVLISVSGLLIFMGLLYQHFHDPLYFYHVQSEFGAGREEQLIVYPQVVWRYLKILITARPIDLRYLIYLEEFLSGVGGAILFWAGWKKMRPSYLFYAVPAFILPTLTGTFSSLPRYLLVCFPIFIILAQILEKRHWLRWLWLSVSLVLLIVNTMMFLQGYWVA